MIFGTPLSLAVILVLTSTSAAVAALLLVSVFDRRARVPAQPLLPVPEPTVFLFEDRELVDATPPAKALLAGLPPLGDDWDRLAAFISERIPDFLSRVADLSDRAVIAIEAKGANRFRVLAESLGAVARLTLCDPTVEGQVVMLDGLSAGAQEAELAALREIADALPVPAWRLDPGGTVTWANRAYLALCRTEDGLFWPLPAVFENADGTTARDGATHRVQVGPADRNDGWYDCYRTELGGASLAVAIPADEAVQAGQALREFRQTLTKTFASLSIGLAIFDRQRRLQLFNPALNDLTALGPEFLAARPTLPAFLDRLRDRQILPEPKNYADWRQQMAEMETAASSGLYEDSWSLPSGQTYRVTGRPHPDGAIAFLFEDISAEVSLTRRFRAELELGQGVLDALDDAIAVFSASGDLTISNRVFEAIWGLDAGTTLGRVSIADATRHWAQQCRPSPVWGDLRDFVYAREDRAEWEGEVSHTEFGLLCLRVVPVTNGGTMVRFSRPAGTVRPARRLRRHRPHRNAAAEELACLSI